MIVVLLPLLFLLTTSVLAGSSPPRIIAWHPPEPEVFNTEGDTRNFSIWVDQIVNVTWRINGTVVQTNENVTFAELTAAGEVSPPPEHWKVSAVVENPNGTDIHTWVWSVAPRRFPPPQITIAQEPVDLHVSDNVGETMTFSVSLSRPCNVYWVVNEAYPGSPADALVNEYHRRIEGEVDVTPIPHRLGGLINERVIRRDVNVSFSKLEIPAAVVGTFSIMAVVQYDEAGYEISNWAWEIKVPIKAPTRWPLIAGIVVIVVVIGIGLTIYLKRR